MKINRSEDSERYRHESSDEGNEKRSNDGRAHAATRLAGDGRKVFGEPRQRKLTNALKQDITDHQGQWHKSDEQCADHPD